MVQKHQVSGHARIFEYAILGSPQETEETVHIIQVTYLSTLPHPLSPENLITPLILYIVCLLYVHMYILTSIFVPFLTYCFLME